MQLGLAPEPGRGPAATAEAQAAADKARRAYLELTFNGETLTLHAAAVTIEDDMLARQQAGVPVSAYVNRHVFGFDSFVVLWWTARRKNGEPALKFADVAREIPDLAAFGAGNPDVVQHDGDDDPAEDTDPEG